MTDFSTEELPINGPNGELVCEGPKVLVCHIPPGNPENAHEICVGEPAVDPHVTNHGDTVGTCEPVEPPVDEADAGIVEPPVDEADAAVVDEADAGEIDIP